MKKDGIAALVWIKPHYEPNRAFCDTSMTFGTQLRVSRRDPKQIWSAGAVAAIFKMADMNFQCPLSRRIIYKTLFQATAHISTNTAL